MTVQEFDKILEKYINGNISDHDRSLVEKWYSALDKHEMEFDASDETEGKKRVWLRLQEHVSEENESSSFSYWRLGRVAAAVTILVVAVGAFLVIRYNAHKFNGSQLAQHSQPEMISIFNDGNNKRIVKLHDGSLVTLKPGSEIRYPAFFQSKREVYLSGEAFFEVTRDAAHPFLVYTNEVTTKVLGTSFLVRANKNEKEIVVSVKTGRVMVYAPKRDEKLAEQVEEVILKPNQQAVYNRSNESVAKKLIENPRIVLPKPTFKMNYNNAPVTDILEALEESYGVDIQFDKNALSACTLTTDLSEEGLFERIEIICNALGANYVAKDTAIVIEAKGCR